MRDEKGRFLKGHKQPEEFKKKMRERRGEKNPRWGKHHTKETKIKMSEAQKGEKGNNWKGGKTIQHGYILILKPDHPYSTVDGYVRQSRLIAEKVLGRYLKPQEKTHHRNGIKDDNSWENLFVFETNADHIRYEWSLRRR